MKKVPSALKWLAEKRARVAGQLRASEATHQHIAQQIAALEKELASIRAVQALATLKVTEHRAALAALDSTIVLYDDKIDPSAIGAVNGWAGRYGKNGALREFLLSVLRARSPEFVSTSELALLAMTEFSLFFAHWKDRKTWYNNSLRNAVKSLERDGEAERSTEAHGGGADVQGWRVKQQESVILAELHKLAPFERSANM